MVTTYRRKAAQLIERSEALEPRAEPAAETVRPAVASNPAAPGSAPAGPGTPAIHALLAPHLPRVFEVSREPLPARLTELLQRLPHAADAPAPSGESAPA